MTTTPAEELAAATENHASVLSELRAAFARRDSLRRSGRGALGEVLRREGADPAEFAAALLACETARSAERESQKRLTRAQEAAAVPMLTRKEAAVEALRFHEIAVEAQAAVESAYAERDAHWIISGRPGQPWQRRFDLGARADVDGGVGMIKSVTRARTDGFDLRAVQKVADGETVAPFQRLVTSPDAGSDQSRAYDAPAEY
jgi:hypothetical protein